MCVCRKQKVPGNRENKSKRGRGGSYGTICKISLWDKLRRRDEKRDEKRDSL